MAESKTSKELSATDCFAKAEDCRELAQHAATDAHRVMLRHMAETWERIASNLAQET